MITVGNTKSDNINRITTITDEIYVLYFRKWDFTKIWSH